MKVFFSMCLLTLLTACATPNNNKTFSPNIYSQPAPTGGIDASLAAHKTY